MDFVRTTESCDCEDMRLSYRKKNPGLEWAGKTRASKGGELCACGGSCGLLCVFIGFQLPASAELDMALLVLRDAVVPPVVEGLPRLQAKGGSGFADAAEVLNDVCKGHLSVHCPCFWTDVKYFLRGCW